jgi:hypothetical protein
VSGRAWGRLLFYVIVLAAVGGVAGHFWYHSVPQQVERALRDIRHPNARVASAAWTDLRELYFTKWAAVEPVVTHAEDRDPISFLVESEPIPVPGKPARPGFWARGKPWYHKTDRVYCQTVGEAIRAFLYTEVDMNGSPRWKRDYTGDWDQWWTTNRGYYGG